MGCVEEKIAHLEGGVGAMMTSSGQAATLLAVLTLCHAGDHIVCSAAVYGGSFNLLGVTLKKIGIETTFVDPDLPLEELQKAIRPETKAVIGETIANPALTVLDIEKFATLAHSNGIPLIVDNTFATPILARPFEFGADIVIHSTSKYMDGHATSLGGVIVDSGKFDWAASGKFPEFTTPDDSYHGVVYTEKFGSMAFIVKARAQLMRDLGSAPSPQNAFLLNLGLETSFGVKGGRKAATRVLDSMKLAAIVTHVADARTCALHPASTTHRQMTDEQLKEGGVGADLIRLSVGIENADDIIEDLNQALANA